MKVGIIGAGTMGSGIAQAFAMTDGFDVLTDTNKELLDFVKTVLNIADFLLQFRITRIREFVILEQLFLDEETALDTV